jgi:hypothetical protein
MRLISILLLYSLIISSVPVYADINEYGINPGDSFSWDVFQSINNDGKIDSYSYCLTVSIIDVNESITAKINYQYDEGNLTAYLQRFPSIDYTINNTNELPGIWGGFNVIEKVNSDYWSNLLLEYSDNNYSRFSVAGEVYSYDNITETAETGFDLYKLSRKYDETWKFGLTEVFSQVQYSVEFYKSSGLAKITNYELIISNYSKINTYELHLYDLFYNTAYGNFLYVIILILLVVILYLLFKKFVGKRGNPVF